MRHSDCYFIDKIRLLARYLILSGLGWTHILNDMITIVIKDSKYIGHIVCIN